ncbi:MAG TPA: hypothetical protein VGR46_12590 [Candidatus Limnocylindria bacterium]|jgi:hypothetical protein|nr:hypothetical protein [Candidatus Limnocylindria bacterium]
MATIALPLRRAGLTGLGTTVPLLIGVAGVFLSWFGAAWDVSWHRLVGRDTFWSVPHLFLYGGVILWGVAALVATVTAMAGRPVRGRELRIGPFRAELGLALVGLGALAVILSAPFDEMWHRTFGRDVDIWSPPHIAGVVGSTVAFLGWSSGFAPGTFSIPEWLRRVLRAVMLANVCGVLVFGMNFYYITATTREAFFYPLLVAAVIPAALGIGATLVGGRWGATVVAATYTVTALATYFVLEGSGWLAPAFPPLIVAGAVAIDVLRARGGRWSHPLVLGLAFSVTFVAAELVRVVLFPAPVPRGLVDGGPDPRASLLFFQYYAQAVARPWISMWPILAAILGAPLASASWVVGRRLGAVLADDPHTEALAHS